AGYLQTRADLFDSTLAVIAGTRLEHSSRSHQTEPTPRLRMSWRAPAGFVVSGAAGSYRQFPGDRLEADPIAGNGDLKAERARHFVLGVARSVGRGRISVEGYHKRLNQLIAYEPTAPAGTPRFYNTGSGTARGIEFLAHVPETRWSAWL